MADTTKAEGYPEVGHGHASEFPAHDHDLCCCPPRAMLWIDARTHSIFVENKIDVKRRLQVRADANASIRPPAGPDSDADGSGGSELEEGTLKEQGKVYRTDYYTIHWRAEGQCQPLLVALRVGGAKDYFAGSISPSGSVTLSATYMMEPPYVPQGPDFLEAELLVRDCARLEARASNRVPRP